MTRVVQFNSPFLLGFDQIERLLDRVTKTAEGYPPYNVEQQMTQEGQKLSITLAVAGFEPADLSVTIEERQLVIRGRQGEDEDKTFLHRGIAARQFQRTFVLADGMVVDKAKLENGLLAISLFRPEPSSLIQTIPITQA